MPYLVSTLTQGGADAFIEASVNTGLSGITNQAIRILRASIEFDGAAARPFSAVAAQQDVEFAMTRRSKSSMPAITDQQVILKKHHGLTVGTAVGYFLQDSILTWEAPNVEAEKLDDGAILVIEDPVYLQLDSTATGYTLVGSVRIEYDTVRITTEDRIRLLELSLT